MLTSFWNAGKITGFNNGIQKPSTQETTGPSFRYVIIYNEVVDAVKDLDSTRTGTKQRFVDILMEEDAFKEQNLRFLYESVSRRFPEPQLLNVSVVTNLCDTETPEEHEGPRTSEPEGPAPVEDRAKLSSSAETFNAVEHPRAVFIRTGDTEMIRYRYPTPKGAKQGEIVLRHAEQGKTRQNSKPNK
jgi:hypothetical protein